MGSRLETSIDKFVQEIQRRGKITFSQAADILGIPVDKVEEWAKLLDKHKEETGIEIHYPAFGEPEIVASNVKKGIEVQEKIQIIKEGSDELEAILEKFREEEITQKEEAPIPVEKKKAEEKTSVPAVAAKPVPLLPTPNFEKAKTLLHMPLLKAGAKKAKATTELQKLEEKLEGVKKIEETMASLSKQIEMLGKEVEHEEKTEQKLNEQLETSKSNLKGLKEEISALIAAIEQKIKKLEGTEIISAMLKELKQSLNQLEAEVKYVEKKSKIVEKVETKSKITEMLRRIIRE